MKDMDITFLLIHLVFCGLNGLDTTAYQSRAFSGNVQKCLKSAISASAENPYFWTLFFKTMPFEEQ